MARSSFGIQSTRNSCLQGRALTSKGDLTKSRKDKCNLRGHSILTLPKVNGTKHGQIAANKWNSPPDNIQ